MNIEYIGRNFHLDERVRKHAAEKLEKLTKFLGEPIEGHVTLETEKHRHKVEIFLTHRFGTLTATEETDGTMTDAVNLATEKIEHQARRAHKRVVDKRRRGDRNGHRWPVDILERDSVGGGGTPRVIESTHLQIKPMTIEEAALQLEETKAEFVVFRDSGSDRVAVLYKRKDENYGLIAPEF
ncbi:MAG TPA: ribosome-associated translation inhibitor RaiA [Thermoanaerobaculia bacterium]|nr:ribosome-associated translation inhibitor RaiA [Thermoanaerobaculia bacterium]